MNGSQPQVIITRSPKSQGIGCLLTFLFGSIGLFYSSITGGIVMLIVELIVFVIGIVTLGVGFLLYFPTHIICLIWGAVAISNYNKRLYSGQN